MFPEDALQNAKLIEGKVGNAKVGRINHCFYFYNTYDIICRPLGTQIHKTSVTSSIKIARE